MAILIVEHRGTKRGATLPPRVLIGRRSMNHLVIDDPAVSRMHAWIDQLGGAFYLTDMHSRSGIRVNGQPVAQQQHQLADGDVIEIGQARLTFREADQLPPEVQKLELPVKPMKSARDVGVQFDCPQCKAPLWAAPQFAGHTAECAYCRELFTVPATGPTAAQTHPPRMATPVAAQPGPAPVEQKHLHPANAAPAVTETLKPAHAVRCGVCQSAILPLEARTTCPACGLLFHEECWQENYGCSAYGCSQVDVLKPPESEQDQAAQASESVMDQLPPQRTPWEFIVLGASAVAVLLSAVSFGGASGLALLAAIVYWVKGKKEPERKRGAIVGAMALSVVGIAAGVALSYYLFIYSGGSSHRR